jgi:GNAT superfamily N-acetyltransferase
MSPAWHVRRWAPGDDAERLTALLHAAYRHHAEAGLRFWATHQTVSDTCERLARGFTFVAQEGDAYVGTVTVETARPDAQVPLYREPDVCSLHQLAVAPSHRGCGLGQALHEAALDHARSCGARRMALDTAEPATGLIALYERWGYAVVGSCDWRPHTNYVSVLLARDLVPRGDPR